MYDALKEISNYQDPARLRRNSLDDWGLDDGDEALEMAYENVLQTAKSAVHGMRRP